MRVETSDLVGWCRACGQAPCLCPGCHGARWVQREAGHSQLIPCAWCRPAAESPPAGEPPVDLKAERAVRRGRTYAERLDL